MARQPKPTNEPQHDPETGEIRNIEETGHALATITENSITTSDGMVLRVKRQVTVPLLAMKVDPEDGENPDSVPAVRTAVVKVLEAIKEGKAIAKGPIRTPARLMRVASISGAVADLIANSVMEKELDENYPGASYVGRWFHITKTRRRHGKRYNDFGLVEIEDPREPASIAQAAE